MQGDEPLLHVGSGAHFLGGAEEDADAPGIHGIEQRLLLAVGVGVVDIGDFLGRNAFGDELVADFVIDVEAVGIGRREVAEDKLRRALVLACLPGAGKSCSMARLTFVSP